MARRRQCTAHVQKTQTFCFEKPEIFLKTFDSLKD